MSLNFTSNWDFVLNRLNKSLSTCPKTSILNNFLPNSLFLFSYVAFRWQELSSRWIFSDCFQIWRVLKIFKRIMSITFIDNRWKSCQNQMSANAFFAFSRHCHQFVRAKRHIDKGRRYDFSYKLKWPVCVQLAHISQCQPHSRINSEASTQANNRVSYIKMNCDLVTFNIWCNYSKWKNRIKLLNCLCHDCNRLFLTNRHLKSC